MYYFTEEGLLKIKSDLEQLKENYKNAIMNLSDERETKLSESGSFLHSRNELCNRFIYDSNKIKEKISKAQLIENTNEYKNWDNVTVIMKSEVEVDFGGEVETYKILGEGEACPTEYIISYESDLAKTLLGHKVGETIPFRGSNITILDVKKIEKGKRKILR